MVNVLDVHSGNFVAAALSQTDKKICVVKHVLLENYSVIMCNLGQCLLSEL